MPLVLPLVYLLYLPRADFSNTLEWVAGGVLLAGVLAQAGVSSSTLASARRASPRSARSSHEVERCSSQRPS
ncbi:MAG: hypothetical protein ACRDSL_03145 [Pseudonocardiaceae bacterium]